MNRQARRRAAREGSSKGLQWDIIIPGALVVVVLAVFVWSYLFPNLNLSTYAGASPRILRKIGDRGITRLRQDWETLESFSFGYFSGAENMPTYLVEKKDDVWAFTDLEDEKTVDYATNNLPDFYTDIPEVLNEVESALHAKDFIVGFQQTVDGMNIFTVTRMVDNEEQQFEQYVLGFNEEHNLDRIIYFNTLEEEISGYAFADLYKANEENEG